MAGAAAEATRVSAAAAAAAGQQDSQATKDAVATTVGVLIVWPALFLIQGDRQNAAQLAVLKGQMDAIEQASIQKNCGIQFRAAPPPGFCCCTGYRRDASGFLRRSKVIRPQSLR